MAFRRTVSLWFLILGFSCLVLISSNTEASDADRKAYIVYMGDLPKGDISPSALHTTMLKHVLGSNASEALVHSYKRSFNGFVARLTEEERQRISRLKGVISVFPSKKYKLRTTRSWDFMGFPQNVKRSTTESDIIIGILDTGIWPESDSFKDEGFGPPPSKWKGSCYTSSNFTCNNKVIGARYYWSTGDSNETYFKSPRDTVGHGTHTASIAAGGLVSKASLYGLASGTARGAVPGARLAVYKVCWSIYCDNTVILAAFDDAIADGVDIISVSIADLSARDYWEDSIAIGSFHAMKKGILTSMAAGNDGPTLGSVSNIAPWALSVAASTIDRKFDTRIQLGNNTVIEGKSINTFEMKKKYPIIYAGDAPNVTGNYTDFSSRSCSIGSLDAALVKDKIVLCDGLPDGEGPLLAGAAGMVAIYQNYLDYGQYFLLPAAYVGDGDASSIFNYANTSSKPTAIILKSNQVNETLAPFVASFSSRGPNTITGDVLKPDITAPGVDILAAFSPVAPVSVQELDKRRANYTILSGTSMACPHASGIAAYIKSFYPSWSPSAIKSAIMTTAFPLRTELYAHGEFASGAGHLNPAKVLDPGLVYDAEEIDYIKFLCGQGYNTTLIELFTGFYDTTCSGVEQGTVWDLNLPSLSFSAFPFKHFSQTFNRTVTNVGAPSSTYYAKVTAHEALQVTVEPRILKFKYLGQKLSFQVKLEGLVGRSHVSGSLVWDDGKHQVKSPIVVHGYLH